MPVTILRWKGGSGGDMVLRGLCSRQQVLNAKLGKILDSGKIDVDFTTIDYKNLSEIQKIALRPQFHDAINLRKLQAEIAAYNNRSEMVWIKSHYYQTDIFNYLTIDIMVDERSLPFVVNSNWTKTDSSWLAFNDVVSKITDADIRKKYTFYCVAQDIVNQDHLSDRRLVVSDIIGGQQKFSSALADLQLQIDQTYFEQYLQWLHANAAYLPSQIYEDQVIAGDYRLDHPGLTLVEKYCLLVLSKQKFRVLA